MAILRDTKNSDVAKYTDGKNYRGLVLLGLAALGLGGCEFKGTYKSGSRGGELVTLSLRKVSNDARNDSRDDRIRENGTSEKPSEKPTE